VPQQFKKGVLNDHRKLVLYEPAGPFEKPSRKTALKTAFSEPSA
jgi:hypothetical protein